MRKKERVILALLLCVLCVFGGCGKNEENVPPEQNKEKVLLGQNDGNEQIEQSDRQENNDILGEMDEQKNEVYVQPEMKGEITISCFYEQEFLTTAAEKFMETYPAVTVTINAYNETSGAGSVEDYQTYLNTKIMTGKAEDIIFNSFLPVTKYSEMGVFEDLNRYISLTPELNDENYFMNVLQAAKEEGGEIYLIPYMAKFNVVSFSEELLSEQAQVEKEIQSASFSERMAIAKELIQNTSKSNVFLIQMNKLSYADYLIKDAFSDFIDVGNKEVNIKSDVYINLLNEVKELSESDAFASGSVDFYNAEYYFAATSDYDVQAAFYELDTNAGLSHGMPVADKEGNVAINANGCLTLNSASGNKDLAWEFIKFVLSDEVQSLPSLHGLAVNKTGFAATVERYYNYYTDGGNDTVDKQKYAELLESWMGQINDCDRVDSAIWILIEEENNKFFEGKQTAEEAASLLQRKLEQYFNE